MQALNWKLAPDTCLAWIVSLVQQVSLVINSDREVAPQDLPLSGPRDGAADNGSVVSNYRTELVERCMAVLDLCSLQMRFLRFRPRVLAAAALQTCCTRESGTPPTHTPVPRSCRAVLNALCSRCRRGCREDGGEAACYRAWQRRNGPGDTG